MPVPQLFTPISKSQADVNNMLNFLNLRVFSQVLTANFNIIVDQGFILGKTPSSFKYANIKIDGRVMSTIILNVHVLNSEQMFFTLFEKICISLMGGKVSNLLIDAMYSKYPALVNLISYTEKDRNNDLNINTNKLQELYNTGLFKNNIPPLLIAPARPKTRKKLCCKKCGYYVLTSAKLEPKLLCTTCNTPLEVKS